MKDLAQADLEVVWLYTIVFGLGIVLIAHKVVAIHEDIKEVKRYLNEIKKRLP